MGLVCGWVDRVCRRMDAGVAAPSSAADSGCSDRVARAEVMVHRRCFCVRRLSVQL